jgi:DNA-binding response OmpR family regulator
MGRTNSYDVIVLDIMLPQRSGFGVIRELRNRDVTTPIICLTARDSTRDKVTGLNLGADDYLTKPFEFVELLARIRALARRPTDMSVQTLRCADLELDPETHKVTRAGKHIDLTPKEYAVLEFLMRREGSVVTRTSIVQNVWGLNFDSLSNVVEVFINRVRNKMDYPFDEQLIHTVRGVGYCLTEREDQ